MKRKRANRRRTGEAATRNTQCTEAKASAAAAIAEAHALRAIVLDSAAGEAGAARATNARRVRRKDHSPEAKAKRRDSTKRHKVEVRQALDSVMSAALGAAAVARATTTVLLDRLAMGLRNRSGADKFDCGGDGDGDASDSDANVVAL
jgi:hypothetical protein